MIENDFLMREFVLIFRKTSIARVVRLDVGDEQGVHVGQKCQVNFRTADDECLAGLGDDLAEIFWGVDHLRTGMTPTAIAGKHDVLTLRQGSADGVEGLSAHDDGVAAGGFFEKREVIGQVPGQGAIAADDAVRGHGNDADKSM